MSTPAPDTSGWAANPVKALFGALQNGLKNRNLNVRQHNMRLEQMAAQTELTYNMKSRLQAQDHTQRMERTAQGHQHGMARDAANHGFKMAQADQVNAARISEMRQAGSTARANMKAQGDLAERLGAGGRVAGFKAGNDGSVDISYNKPTTPRTAAKKTAAPKPPAAGTKTPPAARKTK